MLSQEYVPGASSSLNLPLSHDCDSLESNSLVLRSQSVYESFHFTGVYVSVCKYECVCLHIYAHMYVWL